MHLIREVQWTTLSRTPSNFDEIKQFLLQQNSAGQECSDRVDGSGQLRLRSLIYGGISRDDSTYDFLLQLLDRHPTLKALEISCQCWSTARLSLEDILERLPLLTGFRAYDISCKPIERSRWTNRDDSEHNASSAASSGNSLVIAKAKPPFALQRLCYCDAVAAAAEPDNLFGALPDLMSLDIKTSTLARGWSSQFDFHISAESSFLDEQKAIMLSESLFKNCSKLRTLSITSDSDNVAAILDSQDYITGAYHNPDGQTPLVKLLPRILTEFHKRAYRISRASLDWMVRSTCRGLKILSLPNEATSEITSQDLQRILELCPSLTTFVARGRSLNIEDMAPLSVFAGTARPLEGGADLSCTSQSKNNSEGCHAPRPWACSRTLRRLVVGMIAHTDDPDEHKKAWTQLGQLTGIDALELYGTNLVPKLSYGIGALGDLERMYAFTIEHWKQPPSSSDHMEESNVKDEDQVEAETSVMMDGETTEWIARHWTNLGSLRLDTGETSECGERMRKFVEREQTAGRMRKVQLSTTRLP
ncbi:hypothetical protein BGZ54_008482 [Gamsiella multidivaricata]|nr:hypothetical protein BGZ54_008482 [Gamsiella multidivaricata]